jgi:hypothetical protein
LSPKRSRKIVEGVSEAQKRIAEANVGAAVNPGAVDANAKRKIGKASPVEFDVALVVGEESTNRASVEASAGFLAVVTAKIAGKAEASESARNEAISRIKFSVELAQPADLQTYSYDSRTSTVSWKTA